MPAMWLRKTFFLPRRRRPCVRPRILTHGFLVLALRLFVHCLFHHHPDWESLMVAEMAKGKRYRLVFPHLALLIQDFGQNQCGSPGSEEDLPALVHGVWMATDVFFPKCTGRFCQRPAIPLPSYVAWKQYRKWSATALQNFSGSRIRFPSYFTYLFKGDTAQNMTKYDNATSLKDFSYLVECRLSVLIYQHGLHIVTEVYHLPLSFNNWVIANTYRVASTYHFTGC